MTDFSTRLLHFMDWSQSNRSPRIRRSKARLGSVNKLVRAGHEMESEV